MDPPGYLIEPRSPYFDVPASPAFHFPDSAAIDSFQFDDRPLSPPALLTPSTDSSDSVHSPAASYFAEQQHSPSPPPPPISDAQPTYELSAQSALPSPPTSTLLSTLTTPEGGTLSLEMYSQPARALGPIELVFPLPSLTKPKRSRTNLSHLSNNERLQHKRARHRQIDATRREREKAAIRKLRLLVEEMTGVADRTGGEEGRTAAEQEARQSEEDADGVLGNKTDVLETGITLIEQLRELCSSLQQQNGKSAAVSFPKWPAQATLTTPQGHPSMLQLLPAPTSSIIAHLDRSQTLRASTSVSSPICSIMVLFPGAVVMDVSKSFVEFSGYDESQLLHSHLNPWYLPASSHHTICPLLVDGKDERSGRVTKLVGQYGASKADMGELIKGERGRLDVDWRYRLADRRLVETKTTGWMEDKDRSEEITIEFTDDQGVKRSWSSHRTLIRMVFARQDAVEIDNQQSRDFKPPTWETTQVRSGGRTKMIVRQVNGTIPY